jgi:hypothetical protein
MCLLDRTGSNRKSRWSDATSGSLLMKESANQIVDLQAAMPVSE